ncbi:MAG: carboxypeptidase regulatory-like domain-containing protein [Planctomycetota bacterium]
MRIKRAVSWVLFLIAALGAAVSPAAAHDGTLEPIPDPVYLEGRVVDAEGEPIAGVELYAMPMGVGSTLWRAIAPGSRQEYSLWGATTDAQGAFAIPVAFAEVRYRIAERYNSHTSVGRQEAIAEPGVFIEMVGVRVEPCAPVEGQVLRADGSCAAGAEVVLSGRYPGQRWVQRCDEMGRFKFDQIYALHWDGGTVYARLDGEVSAPHSASRLRSTGGRVQLGLPATAVGVLRDLETGEPIAGATIIIEPRRRPMSRWTATTHDDGWFQILDLPPGDYQYRALCETYADQPPNSDRWDSRRIRLRAGETTELDGFHMELRARVAGRVLDAEGEPVEGALVGAYCHAGRSSGGAIDGVFTDAAGRFELRPGVIEANSRSIYAYHPEEGVARFRLQTLAPGEHRTDLALVMAGSTRLRGQVTGPDGEPVAGVRCSYLGSNISATTDDHGRYDLGRVPLSASGDHGGLREVRVATGSFVTDGDHTRWPSRAYNPDASYYIAKREQGELGPHGDTAVDIRLEGTDVLAFGGQVRQVPVPGERGPMVYLLHGRVERDTSHDAVLDFLKLLERRDQQLRERGFASELPLEHDICVFRTIRSDKLGRWSAHYTRYDLEVWARNANRVQREGLTEEEQLMREFGLPVHQASSNDAGAEPGEHEAGEAEAEPAMQWVTVLVVLGERAYELQEPIELRMDKVDYTDPGLGAAQP